MEESPEEKLSLWKRLREAYQFKQRTDQTFYATVIALKVFLIALVLIAVLFFSFWEPDVGSPASLFLQNPFMRKN